MSVQIAPHHGNTARETGRSGDVRCNRVVKPFLDGAAISAFNATMNDQLSTSPLVPSTLFASTSLPVRDQFEAWQDRISVIFNVEPIETGIQDGFPAEALAYHLGDLILARTRFEAQRFVRMKQRARSDMLDHYLVQFYNEGGYSGELDGESIEIRAGMVSVLDLARSTQTRATAAECVSLVVPRDVMHQLVPRAVNLHGAVLDTGNGRLFSNYLFSLLRQLPTTQQSQATHIARATCHLLAACLLPTAGKLDRSCEFGAAEELNELRERISGCLHLPGPSAAPTSKHENFDDWIRALRI